MKRKIGTVLEERLFKELKKRAADEQRPLAEILHDAVVAYLQLNPSKQESLQAWQWLNSNPIRVSDEDLQAVLRMDMWEQ
ncbi:MAG TPA: hypothetical protein VGK99_11455 [Acidobacteriota bacterium]|jgi:hypothetical protein|nr:hypothetical protein [Blastocatellia bacterium]